MCVCVYLCICSILNHKLHQNEDERTSNVLSAFS